MKLDNQIAIVTGGDKGIGRAITIGLAKHGANVVIANRNEESAKETIVLCSQFGRDISWIKTDVSIASEIDRLIKCVMNRFGRIDILVNNAGVSSIGKIWEIDEEDYDWNYRVNEKGVFLCSKAVSPIMIRQGQGNIINIASRAAKVPVEYQGHYGATKAAVLLLTRNFASELAQYGIRVNAVCPGKVDTDMLRGEWIKEMPIRNKTLEQIEQEVLSKIPLRRLVQPEDIANVVVFLASSYSAAMTGQSVNVTCGQEMR